METWKNLFTYINQLKCLNRFNATFKDTQLIDLTLDEPNNYQRKILRENMAPAPVYMEDTIAHVMLNIAYHNDKVS